MTIPFQAIVIPLYIMMVKLHLTNTYASVILPSLAPAFGIFLMRQSIRQILSDELMDAARIDGATEFGIYFRILLPILKPTLAALGMIFVVASWNNFFWPLIILTTRDMLTITVALANIVGAAYGNPYGALMLGSSISFLPVLIFFIVLQKHFEKGLTVGSFR
jgi:ABC-type glycerol-3-phosphate transport system permease component